MFLAVYLRIAHFGFFQSHIIFYSLILWGQSQFVIEMLLVQKKIIKILCKTNPFLHHCRPLFIHTPIMNVINLYIFLALAYTKTHLYLFNTLYVIIYFLYL